MTTNQLRFQELMESKRKNAAVERETKRSNMRNEDIRSEANQITKTFNSARIQNEIRSLDQKDRERAIKLYDTIADNIRGDRELSVKASKAITDAISSLVKIIPAIGG